MLVKVEPGAVLSGAAKVPGDKSIAHRWLILAATGAGKSVIRCLPNAGDVRSTARCLSRLIGSEELGRWSADARSPRSELMIEADGRGALTQVAEPLDCGNSGTTMRLLAGLVAGCRFETVLAGDESLSRRPMERLAKPLRLMGAEVATTDSHAPLQVKGAALSGITYEMPVPSAQVKSAVLLAGLAAEGETAVVEPAESRDHTERVLAALGAPIRRENNTVAVSAFQHEGLEGDVPGDVSSSAFLVAAAALTGGRVAVRDVGLNPTRSAFLGVMKRMGVHVGDHERWESLGEPAGVIEVEPGCTLRGTVVAADELPLLIDEVPVLAMLAAHAVGESRFEGAGELRVKESDRLGGTAECIRALGGGAAVEGDALVVEGGGLAGGRASSAGDHRLAMALAVGALAARSDCLIDGMEWADISFPGFVETLVGLGACAEQA